MKKWLPLLAIVIVIPLFAACGINENTEHEEGVVIYAQHTNTKDLLGWHSSRPITAVVIRSNDNEIHRLLLLYHAKDIREGQTIKVSFKTYDFSDFGWKEITAYEILQNSQ